MCTAKKSQKERRPNVNERIEGRRNHIADTAGVLMLAVVVMMMVMVLDLNDEGVCMSAASYEWIICISNCFGYICKDI